MHYAATHGWAAGWAVVVEHLTKRFKDRVAFDDMSFEVGHPSTGLALGLAAVLLAIDGLAWRAVTTMFDRERLITVADDDARPYPRTGRPRAGPARQAH